MKKTLIVFAFSILVSTQFVPLVFAANANTLQTYNDTEDIYSKYFNLVVCDGPALPTQSYVDSGTNTGVDSSSIGKQEQAKLSNSINPHLYRVCDFNAAMREVQHLINIMMVLGVLAAIVGFSYAGYLYITGVPGNITQAHDIFRKVFLGFVLMLCAWFIVYQLIAWLVPASSGVKYLLGNP